MLERKHNALIKKSIAAFCQKHGLKYYDGLIMAGETAIYSADGLSQALSFLEGFDAAQELRLQRKIPRGDLLASCDNEVEHLLKNL